MSCRLEILVCLEPFLSILTVDLAGEIVASLRELQGLVRNGVACVLVQVKLIVSSARRQDLGVSLCVTGTVLNSVDNLVESIVTHESLLTGRHYVSDIVDSFELLNRLDEVWLRFSLREAEQADPLDPLVDLELVVGPLCIVPVKRI